MRNMLLGLCRTDPRIPDRFQKSLMFYPLTSNGIARSNGLCACTLATQEAEVGGPLG